MSKRQTATAGSRAASSGSRRFNPALVGTLVASIAAIAGVACVVHARVKKAERDNPAKGRFVEVEGVRLHFVERGEGPAVILLHGNGAMIEDWEISGVLGLVAAGHRVIAFDRPGFGHSERPRERVWTPQVQAHLLDQACAVLGIDRAVVVGHSWGTLVALAFALENPGKVDGLVLLSGYYFPTPRADVVLLSPPALPFVGDVMRHTVSPFLGRALAPKLFAKIFAPMPVPPQFIGEFPLDLALRPSQIHATAADTALMIPAAATLSNRYGELTMPVSIMAGTDDEIVDPFGHSRRLKELIADSEYRLIEGCGHMIHHLLPQEVVHQIESVAARSSRQGRTKARGAQGRAPKRGVGRGPANHSERPESEGGWRGSHRGDFR